MKTITLDCQVGIYERCHYVLRLYPSKIVITTPYVKWESNSTGGYAERKDRIMNPLLVAKIRVFMKNGQEHRAWAAIGEYLNDPYLRNAIEA